MHFIDFGNYCSYDQSPVSFIENGRDLLYIFECNQKTVASLITDDANYQKFVKTKSGIVIFATSLHSMSWSGIMPFMAELDKKEDNHGKSITVVIPENNFIDYLIDNYPYYRDYDSQALCLAKAPGVAYDIVHVSKETELDFEEHNEMIKKIHLFHCYDKIKSYSVLLTKSDLNSGVLYTGYEGTDVTNRKIRKILSDYDIDNFVISVNGIHTYPDPILRCIPLIPYSIRSKVSFVNTKSCHELAYYNYMLSTMEDQSSQIVYNPFDGGTKE